MTTGNDGAPTGGGLTLDQGAAAIGEIGRDTRNNSQPRDRSTGRYTASQSEMDQGAPGGADEDIWDDPDDEEEDAQFDESSELTDEADGEGDDAGEDGEGESDEDQRREPTYRVVVNGEETDVPVSELVAGYQRNADYSRKTQTLAQERKALHEHGQRVVAERQAYTQLLGNVHEFLMSQAPSEEVVNRLMMLEDPVEGFRAKQIRDQIVGKASEFGDAYKAMIAGSQAEIAQQIRQEMLQAVQKLPELIPEWKDSKRMQAERDAVHQYAQTYFTPDELAEITDARAMVFLRKSMLYDRLMARGSEKLKAAVKRGTQGQRGSSGQAQQPQQGRMPPAQRRDMQPGSRSMQQGGPNRRQVEQVRERARKSGSIEDVARLISLTE